MRRKKRNEGKAYRHLTSQRSAAPMPSMRSAESVALSSQKLSLSAFAHSAIEKGNDGEEVGSEVKTSSSKKSGKKKKIGEHSVVSQWFTPEELGSATVYLEATYPELTREARLQMYKELFQYMHPRTVH